VLRMLLPDYHTPAIQIGFNFAEASPDLDSLSRMSRQMNKPDGITGRLRLPFS